MTELLLRHCRPWGGDRADILVRDGVIAAIASAIDVGTAEVVDLGGDLVLPALVDAHCHLDKTLFGGDWVPHTAGDPLTERMNTERRRRAELGLPSMDNIAALLETMVVAGTTHAGPMWTSIPTSG